MDPETELTEESRSWFTELRRNNTGKPSSYEEIGVPVTELRADLEAGEITGYASVFNVIDSYGTKFAKGAFTRSLSERGMPRLLFNHGFNSVIGVVREAFEDRKGLFFRAKISDTTLGRDTLTLIRDGALTDVSIGFITRKQSDPDKQGVITKQDVDLWDISPVTFGANPAAKLLAVRSGGLVTEDVLMDLARDDEFLSLVAKRVAGGSDDEAGTTNAAAASERRSDDLPPGEVQIPNDDEQHEDPQSSNLDMRKASLRLKEAELQFRGL